MKRGVCSDLFMKNRRPPALKTVSAAITVTMLGGRWRLSLVEEAWLLILNAKLAVDGGEDALHLSEGEHAA